MVKVSKISDAGISEKVRATCRSVFGGDECEVCTAFL